jgi:hypothetical protein
MLTRPFASAIAQRKTIDSQPERVRSLCQSTPFLSLEHRELRTLSCEYRGKRLNLRPSDYEAGGPGLGLSHQPPVALVERKTTVIRSLNTARLR